MTVDDRNYSINQLFKIFNTLKALEGKAFYNHSVLNKNKKDKELEFSSIPDIDFETEAINKE